MYEARLRLSGRPKTGLKLFTHFSTFKQPKRRIKIAAQSLTCSTLANVKKELDFYRQNPSVWYWHSIVNTFSLNSDSDEKKSWPLLNTLNGPLRSAVVPAPKIDTTVACQSSYTEVFASGGSFQDVCGELIRVGQNHPVQRSPLSLTFCGERFGCPWLSKK